MVKNHDDIACRVLVSLILVSVSWGVLLVAPAMIDARVYRMSAEMVRVGPGRFVMGTDDGSADQSPAHEVVVTRTLLVSKYKVTQADYAVYCSLTGKKEPLSRWGNDPALPVIGVDWRDAVEYCNWLSIRGGLAPCYSGSGHAIRCDFDSSGYRLPTEAEWEWIARGGNLGTGYSFAGSDDPLKVAWFDENSEGRMHPVGSLEPNELGIYDLSGNLYEWCWDYYSRTAYAESAGTDPVGPAMLPRATPRGPERVRRAGSWRENRESVSVAFRSLDNENYPGDNGFRVIRTIPPDS